MKLELAQTLAKELVYMLGPDCERIEVTGGIRRKKPEPHDIELVAIPRMRAHTITTPLGTQIDDGLVNALDERMHLLDTLGTIQRGDPSETTRKSKVIGIEKVLIRAPFGEKLYRVKYKGEKVDLFVVLPPKCLSCGAILKESNASAGKEVVAALQENVRPVREVLRGTEPPLLLPRLRQAGDEVKEPGRVRSLSEALLPAAVDQGRDVQPSMRSDLPRIEEVPEESKMDGISAPVPHVEAEQTDRVRLRQSLHAAAPERDEQGDDHGAPLGDGAASRALSQERRGGAPQERSQERQSRGESRTGDARPQRGEGPMPLVRDNLSRSLKCPHCNSTKIKFENSWGAIFAIRTGDKDYSQWLVQQGYPRGIHEDKGHLERWWHDGYETLVTTQEAKYPDELRREVLQTPEEEDFFKALGVWMPPPELRGFESMRRVALPEPAGSNQGDTAESPSLPSASIARMTEKSQEARN